MAMALRLPVGATIKDVALNHQANCQIYTSLGEMCAWHEQLIIFRINYRQLDCVYLEREYCDNDDDDWYDEYYLAARTKHGDDTLFVEFSCQYLLLDEFHYRPCSVGIIILTKHARSFLFAISPPVGQTEKIRQLVRKDGYKIHSDAPSLKFLCHLAIDRYWLVIPVHRLPMSVERSMTDFFVDHKAQLVHDYENYTFISAADYSAYSSSDDQHENVLIRRAIFPLPRPNKSGTFHIW